ncbi:hypothetical protein [Ekhidna sp.]|uniref:hypothetical protein n=1 Tax=Ekhidna sp. TaxID=2608089 RepID=UPI003B598503
MKNLIKSLFIVFTGMSCSLIYAQSGYPMWKELKSGSYQVGFKTIDYLDKSRSIPGEIGDTQFFPIQIAIWYPTSDEWTREKAVSFEHYFLKTAQKNDFKQLTEEQRKQAMDIFFGYAKHGLSIDFSSGEREEIGNRITAAIPEAKQATGPFPVLLAGHDGGVWKMSTLCEYLASHGYVVISTGPLSASNRLFRQHTQQAINRRIRTLEIVRGMLDQFPAVDQSKIGLLGLNSDGLSTLLYQMKNQEADAMVSIDGWEGKNNGAGYAKESVYFDLSKVQIPRLEFHQHESLDNEALYVNTSIFDSLTQIDRLSYIMMDFGHAYLTGNLFVLSQLDQKTNEQHYFWYESIRHFFDAYLKNDASSEKRLWTNQSGESGFFYRDKRIRGK